MNGSIPTGRGIFAPVIQVNDRFGSSDAFGTPELNVDIRFLAEGHGIYCFYYGPPLWQFGKPPEETGHVVWLDEDIDYVLDNCPETILGGGRQFYRARLDLAEADITPLQFCTPPDELRTRLWRFDSDDVPVFYGAFDVETCLHESRVTLQHDILVATLEAERPLKILDLGKCRTPSDVTRFEDPEIWLRALLFDGPDSYPVCRRLAKRIMQRGYDGFAYTSFFQQAAERPHRNLALFHAPIRAGIASVASINRVKLNDIAYQWQFGPVVVGAYG